MDFLAALRDGNFCDLVSTGGVIQLILFVQVEVSVARKKLSNHV